MKKYIFILLSAVFLSSCSVDEMQQPAESIPVSLSSALSMGQGSVSNLTRTISQTVQTGSALTTGASAGVYIYSNGKNGIVDGYGYSNYKYTVTAAASGNGLSLDQAVSGQSQPYYRADNRPIDIYVYTPYIPNAETNNAIEVLQNQSSETNYIASDYIFGSLLSKTASFSSQNVAMRHLLSKVNVNLIPGNGFTASDLKGATITLKNIKRSGTLTLPSGTVTLNTAADVSDVIMGTTESSDVLTASAIIIPQTLTNGTEFIEITLSNGSTKYAYALDENKTFKGNTVDTYNITVTSAGLSISNTVQGWTAGSTKDGIAELE